MLAALLMLGILPFAVMPFGADDQSDDDGDPGSDEPGEITGLPGDPGGAGSVEGDVHTVTSDPGTTVLNDFEPGTDLVELDLSLIDGEISFDAAITENGASVSFSVGSESTTTIVFDGLSEVPAGDIMLRLADEETGEPYDVSLGDVAAYAQHLAGLGSDPGVSPGTGETGGVIEPTDPETPEPGGATEVTGPVIDPTDPSLPDPPGSGTDPDPATVLEPVDPALPDPPGPGVDPVTVVNPTDPNLEVLGPEVELPLHELLERDSENTTGQGAALTEVAAAGSVDTTLGTGDDNFALADDGVDGTGSGAIGLHETVPVISQGGSVQVVDGGAGDDQISTGDDAAFAFGGEGDDTLSAGEGVAALYGGPGDDVLSASVSDAYLDGGAGDDAISGGTGDDILEGGEHGAGEASGDDTINGGAGDDLIRGGYGADMLSGGAGDDVIDHLGRTEERASLEQHEFGWHTDGEADNLSGGAGDDTLIFDREDQATGGEGSDLFWLYHDGADAGGVAEVTDFVVGEDFLRVSLNPNIGENDEPDVLVEPSDDGSDGVVIVNGDVVAILRGAPGATVSDIYAEVRADIFG